MCKISLVIFIAMFIICGGCVNATYISPTGESFSYNRLGTQKISGFKITRDDKGLVKLQFDTQEGSEGKMLSDLSEAIKNITALKVP